MAHAPSSHPLRPLKYVLGFLALIEAWLNLAPVKFGGRLSYLIVQGTSMLPRFHTNDVVIVTVASHYHVGELAAYHNLQLHSVLFHQIVGQVGTHYLFKGLNNAFIDAYHPIQSQIIGQFLWAIPGAGNWIAFFRQPWHAASLMMGLTLLLWGGMGHVRVHSTNGPHLHGANHRKFIHAFSIERSRVHVKTTLPRSPKIYYWLLAGTEILAAAFLAAAVWAWMSPVHRNIIRSIPYQIHSQFLYQAHVPKGTVYPTGTVVPGSSVFLKLTHAVQIIFQGRWQSPGSKGNGVTGQGELMANMVSSSGWSSSWVLSPQSSWTGPNFALKGTIDTDALNAHISQVNQQTGLPYNTYTLTITPHVVIRGKVLGQPFGHLLTSPLVFSYSPEVMQLTSPTPNINPITQLHPLVNNSIPYSVVTPNRLGLGVFKAPVIPLRWINTVGLGTLVLLSFSIWNIKQRWGKSHSEADYIAAQFGDLLIPVVDTTVPSVRDAIQVPSMEFLVKLADQYELPIFYYLTANNTHWYIIRNGRETYYYQIRLSPGKTTEVLDTKQSVRSE